MLFLFFSSLQLEVALMAHLCFSSASLWALLLLTYA